jgi:hypothetical protein
VKALVAGIVGPDMTGKIYGFQGYLYTDRSLKDIIIYMENTYYKYQSNKLQVTTNLTTLVLLLLSWTALYVTVRYFAGILMNITGIWS